MRLLIAEDDEMLADGVCRALRRAGHVVDRVADGDAADTALRTYPFDAVILDLALPCRSGSAVLEAARGRGDDTPVLILTAFDATEERVAGLDRGADDYLAKPFEMSELLARLRALHRRASGRGCTLIEHAGICLDPATHQVTLEGEPVDLSPLEFRLLERLLDNAGRVVSRARLEEALYVWCDEPASNVIEVHVHNLRRKFGRELIRTIRGVGYLVR